MKRLTYLFLLVIFFLTSSAAKAQYYSIDFIENKGQWEGDFLFKGNVGNSAVFVEKNGYTLVLYNSDEMANVVGHKKVSTLINKVEPVKINADEEVANGSDKIHFHAYRVNFVDANSFPEIMPEKPSGEKSNYFLGNDPSKWKKDVQGFNNVLIKNIYPGVDVRYSSTGGSLKYDLIVHPGADISKIKLNYSGIDKMLIKDNELLLETSLGVVKEGKPYSYQIVDGIKKEIDAAYQINNNVVQYKIRRISDSEDLIIDPSVQLATFTGSAANNWGFTAAPGPDGSLFAGGIVFGPGYIRPGDLGGFQINFQGGIPDTTNGLDPVGVDVAITKFSPDGQTKLYNTYLGGSINEYPHSIYVDKKGEAVILGRTSSIYDFPKTKSHGNTGGGLDIFVTRLSSDGSALVGSAVIGEIGRAHV